MYNKKVKKIISIFIVIMMCFTLFFCSASAAEPVIIDKTGSIVLHLTDSKTDEFIQGASFRLYFFAAAYEKSNGVGYDYVIPYDNCDMDMDNLKDAYLPIHLTHFALSNDLSYVVETTNANGTVVFDNLIPGVYLIVPENNIANYHMPSPFVINIPMFDKINNEWVYDINASPKIQMHQIEDSEGTTYIRVEKQWETAGEHPDSVTVSLLRDYREVEKVVLNEENNWQYRWNDLSKMHSWSVVESVVPDGYTVSYKFTQNTVAIINKGEEEPSTIPSSEPTEETTVTDEGTTIPEETTSPEGTTMPEITTKPEGATNPTKPTKPESTTKPEELIDTGQLNWPVPVFSIAGLILFSIGWAMLNIGKKDEEVL